MCDTKSKEYHHTYYITHYKDIIKNKTSYCSVCDRELTKWNIYKHNKSKQHIINSMTEQERRVYEEQVRVKQIEQKRQRLLRQLEQLNGG